MAWLQDLIRELAGGGGTIDSKAVVREATRRGYIANDSSVSQAMRRAEQSGELQRGGRSGGGRGKGPGAREYRATQGDE